MKWMVCRGCSAYVDAAQSLRTCPNCRQDLEGADLTVLAPAVLRYLARYYPPDWGGIWTSDLSAFAPELAQRLGPRLASIIRA